jgi:hypothetical protein
MSGAAINWARTVRAGNPTVKAVLACLATYANPYNVAYPSQRLMSMEVEVSVDTIQRALRKLEAKGLIQTVPWMENGRKIGNQYHLLMGESPEEWAVRQADIDSERKPHIKPKRKPHIDLARIPQSAAMGPHSEAALESRHCAVSREIRDKDKTLRVPSTTLTVTSFPTESSTAADAARSDLFEGEETASERPAGETTKPSSQRTAGERTKPNGARARKPTNDRDAAKATYFRSVREAVLAQAEPHKGDPGGLARKWLDRIGGDDQVFVMQRLVNKSIEEGSQDHIKYIEACVLKLEGKRDRFGKPKRDDWASV